MSNLPTPTTKLALSVEALHAELRLNKANEGAVRDMLGYVLRSATDLFKSVFTAGGMNLLSTKASYESDGNYKHLKPADFPTLAKQPLSTMEGFHGKYVEYSPVVLKGLNYYEEHLDEALRFYQMLVGSILTNKSSRSDWQDLTPRFNESDRIRSAEDKDNAEFWVAGSFETVRKVGDVVSQIRELHQLDADANALVKKLGSLKLTEVKNRVDTINDTVVLLSKELANDKIPDLSKTQVANLANGIMELANQVEHFAIAVYRGHVYVQALKRLQDVVKSYQ